MEKETVIIADDDKDIREILAALLKNEGYNTIEASDGNKTIEALKAYPYAGVILLDIMMPELDGIQVCSAIRAFSTVPVVFLTAKTSIYDKKQAYDAGGDDYLAKPFSKSELVMKVSSIIRRYRSYNAGSSNEENILTYENLSINTKKHTLSIDGEPLELTQKEYGIITLLLKNRAQTLSPEAIYMAVWDEKFLDSSVNTVMVHMLNLRRKLTFAGVKDIIRTVWGKGYTID